MTMNTIKENALLGKEWSTDKMKSTKVLSNNDSRSLSLMSLLMKTTPDR